DGPEAYGSTILEAPSRRKEIQRSSRVARADRQRYRPRKLFLFPPAPFSYSPFLKLVIPNPVAHWHAVSGLQRIGANGGEGSAFRFLATRHLPPLFTSAVDLANAPSDSACVLHQGHSRNARLLHRQAWLRMFGDVAGTRGL